MQNSEGTNEVMTEYDAYLSKLESYCYEKREKATEYSEIRRFIYKNGYDIKFGINADDVLKDVKSILKQHPELQRKTGEQRVISVGSNSSPASKQTTNNYDLGPLPTQRHAEISMPSCPLILRWWAIVMIGLVTMVWGWLILIPCRLFLWNTYIEKKEQERDKCRRQEYIHYNKDLLDYYKKRQEIWYKMQENYIVNHQHEEIINCPNCKGTYRYVDVCMMCKGTGIDLCLYAGELDCPECGGAQKVICRDCHGVGKVTKVQLKRIREIRR